jgi:hypothetical protein
MAATANGSGNGRGRGSVRQLLDQVVERATLRQAGGQGYSGAKLEAVRLADGTRLVVKRISPATDLTMRLTHDRGRAATLFTTGVLDRLPPAVDHTIVAAEPDGDGWLIVMRDVSAAFLPDERALTHSECRRVFAAAAAIHETYHGQRIEQLCSLTDWVSLMSPTTMTSVGRDGDNELPGAVLRGWELFDDLAPRDIADALRAVHARPERLAAELVCGATTLVHGDLWLANLGLLPGRVVIIDWGLATQAPAALEFTMFLTGAWSRVAATREQILDDARAAGGEHHDERALQLALLATFANFGWNKALDAVEHPDPAIRARETAELTWWVERARHTLETTWSPI